MNKVLINLILLLFLSSGTAQNRVKTKEDALNTVLNYTALKQDYPFIKWGLNSIHNANHLDSLYFKLYQVKSAHQGKVRILHIGDSHLQADYISNASRVSLQHYFGNGGRGLIFPYKYAKTNGPDNYRSQSNINWISNRILTSSHVGLAGYRLFTNNFIAELSLAVNDQYELDYGFTSATIFTGMNEALKMSLYDNDSPEQALEDSTFENSIAKRFLFSKPVHRFYQASIDLEKQLKIHDGVLLENNHSGLIYNSMGVNGAMYSHYTKSESFYQELEVLQPNLVIFSLGTNEGFSAKIDEINTLEFKKNVTRVLDLIRQTVPNASIILVSPPDSYKTDNGAKVKNPNIKTLRATLLDLANEQQLAYWDLFTIMGGYGSMHQWAGAKMTDNLWIHFSKKGYQIQGLLFAQAFMEGFENYCKKNKLKLYE